jgi:hypothetical protein
LLVGEGKNTQNILRVCIGYNRASESGWLILTEIPRFLKIGQWLMRKGRLYFNQFNEVIESSPH